MTPFVLSWDSTCHARVISKRGSAGVAGLLRRGKVTCGGSAGMATSVLKGHIIVSG